MIHISLQHVLAVNSVTLGSDNMFDSEFSNYIEIKNRKNNESIRLDQRRVKLRENANGLMAVSYLAPVFEAFDLENFFDETIASEKLDMDIGGTGSFTVMFRGMVDGKGKNLPENLDHKIILLQEPKCLDPRENIQITGFSRFKLKSEMTQ